VSGPTQRYTASLRRRDGHTIDGVPGDCFRTAIACLLGRDRDDVPHFGLRLSWWEETRRWIRANDGRDLYYVDGEHPEHWDLIPGGVGDDALVLIGGPSPRGPFKHVCVGRRDGSLVWDPHPSRDGLAQVVEFFVLGPAYYRLMPRLELLAGSR
jgi:hypothetical protein